MRALPLAVAALGASCLGPVLELPPPRKASAPVEPAETRGVQSGAPARARVISERRELVEGEDADGELGDFRIDNGRVAFVIARAGDARGLADGGGSLLDAVAGGTDALRQIVVWLGDGLPRQPIYDTVETARIGDRAIVRAAGHDSELVSLQVVTEYSLGPGANELELTTILTNAGDHAVKGLAVGDHVAWGRAERFLPGVGFDAAPGKTTETPEGWVGALSPEASYAYVVIGALRGRHGFSSSTVELERVDLEPGEHARVTRWLVAAAAPDATFAETLARLRREKWARLDGRVVEDGSGSPLAGARLVLADRAHRPVLLTTSALGGYVQLAPPAAYFVSAQAPGRRGPRDLEVDLHVEKATTLDLVLSRPGALSYSISEGGRGSPAKLTLFGVAETRTPRLGPMYASPGGNVVLTVDGRGQFELPPGKYRVFASRGPAFSVEEKEIEVTPGAATRVSFELSRVVDWPNLVCADLDQHAASFESPVSLADRAASHLAEGLEVLIADRDYHDVLGKLGARAPSLVRGVEVGRDGVGHFGAYPLARPIETRGLGGREILAALRKTGARVVQVNHPREGRSGWFNAIGLDAHAPSLPPGFEPDFDALEVLAGKRVSAGDEPLADWLALMGRGLVYSAVGGSDAHLLSGDEVGYPRTCAVVEEGKPVAEGFVEALRKKEGLVTTGPFIRASIGGKGPGHLAGAPRGRARLDVEVWAAPWVEVKRLELIVGGERRGKPMVLLPGKTPLRWRGSIELKLDRDAAVVLVARGDQPLDPVVSRPLDGAALPFAVTNPILVDRDGDGKFGGVLQRVPAAPENPPKPTTPGRPVRPR